MVKRYPHTATISYVGVGTFNSLGILTEGTLTTIGIVCNIQPQPGRSSLHLTGPGGIVIEYDWHIYTPLYAGFSSVPDGAKLEFFNKDHIITQLFIYQKHAEILC